METINYNLLSMTLKVPMEPCQKKRRKIESGKESSRGLCGTKSKAFVRSKKTAQTVSLFLSFFTNKTLNSIIMLINECTNME